MKKSSTFAQYADKEVDFKIFLRGFLLLANIGPRYLHIPFIRPVRCAGPENALL
jgi:hypothetical protein